MLRNKMKPPRRRIWVVMRPRSKPKVVCGRGATRGDSVSSHLRSGFAVFFLVAGLSTPAASNALTDLFSPNAAPEPAATAAAAPAKEECLSQPGRSTAAGQHWVYRYDGQRKCWFQAAEDTALAKRQPRHRVAPQSVAAPEQEKSAPPQQKGVEDARAELVNSAPADTPQPAPPEPTVRMVRTVPVRLADAAAQVPPAPDLNTPAPNKPNADPLMPDQPTSDQSAPRQLDAISLLSHAPAAGEEVASMPLTTPIAAPVANRDGGKDWMPSWLGALLIALGGAALLSSSPTLRRALWPLRSPGASTELPVAARSSRNEPAFAQRASASPASGEPIFSSATRRDGPRTARARRPLAAG